MSRLFEILQKRGLVESYDENGDDISKHTPFSPAGNLFKLMLVMNPDYPVKLSKKTNVVSGMLASLMEDPVKATSVKKLQTVFNSLKSKMITGKSVAATVKKEYFTHLFTLMLPLVDAKKYEDPSKGAKSLATVFAKSDPASYKPHIISIGKALKTVGALNVQDSKVIGSYLSGISAEITSDMHPATAIRASNSNTSKTTKVKDTVVEPPTEDVADTPQPLNQIEQVVDTKKSLKELTPIKEDTDKVLTEIKKEVAVKFPDISSMLKKNTSAEVFKLKINNTDADSEAKQKLNSKIEEFYEKTKEEFGPEVANSSTKILSSCLNHLSSVKGYLKFIQNDINMQVIKVEDDAGSGHEIRINAGTQSSSDNHFSIVRTIKDVSTTKYGVTTKKRVATLEKMLIPLNAQNSGINKKLFKDVLAVFKAQKVDKIELEANVDVGGYAWFRYGFVPRDAKETESITLWIKNIGPVIGKALEYDATDIANFIKNNSKNPSSAGITNLVELLLDVDKDPKEKKTKLANATKIITALTAACSAEFRTAFFNKRDQKVLATKTGILNFKEYKIGGSIYSISYKALLSIQSLHVQGLRVIPLNSIYLNWKGELDMNDLDITHAYLSAKGSKE